MGAAEVAPKGGKRIATHVEQNGKEGLLEVMIARNLNRPRGFALKICCNCGEYTILQGIVRRRDLQRPTHTT